MSTQSEAPPEQPIRIEVAPAEDGERLDRLIAQRPLDLSRSVIQEWIAHGRVQLNGQIATRRSRPRAGDELIIWPLPPPPSEAAPEAIALHILYEDEHLLVLDKPPHMVVHPAPGHSSGTLVNALLHHAGAALPGEAARPGIVHRLDKDTSGVMVVAKTPPAREGLVGQFRAHSIERAYQALVVGDIGKPVTLDTLHGRHPVHRKKFTARVKRGRRAVTHVRPVERFEVATRLECRLQTGRTHQIRVHLSEQGHPILGDPLYGRAPRDKKLRLAAEALGRQALHAAVLGFTHPVTIEPLRFETPLPADFQTALEMLRG